MSDPTMEAKPVIYDSVIRRLGVDMPAYTAIGLDREALDDYFYFLHVEESVIEAARAMVERYLGNFTGTRFTIYLGYVMPEADDFVGEMCREEEDGFTAIVSDEGDLMLLFEQRWVSFGDVVRRNGLGQCQYASRYVDPAWREEYPDLGDGLRLQFNSSGDYHRILIHFEDVPTLLERFAALHNVGTFSDTK
ncbi:hypothetical protein HGA91_00140 [candidate division WWE3 bacterium]|nr:hypothetical protein [candidate division WWE3 bacterium]